MAKAKTQPKTDSPLEFWAEGMGDDMLLILAREKADGTIIGKIKWLPKAGLTPRKFGRAYEELLHDFQADYPNEPLA